jgi:phosphotransferase system  glucose/maltose/N-acetylglucosamine-specific IIC component
MSATNDTATTTAPTAASRRLRLLGALQTLARAVMLLIAVLPVAALLLKLGHLDLLLGGG